MNTKITVMPEDEMLAKLSANLHGPRDEALANTLVLRYQPGTKPAQWKDIGSGLVCVRIDVDNKTATFTNWSGTEFTYQFSDLRGVFTYREYMELGGTKEAILALFE